jgi:hypothetical protein
VLEVCLRRCLWLVRMNGEGCGKDGDCGVEVEGYCGCAGSDREECGRGRGC